MIKANRLVDSPILTPTSNWWENFAVYNPGAALFDSKIVLLYRAVGTDRISRFGLAVSDDGVHFERSTEPIFESDLLDPNERLGVEDPRIVKIDDEYLITYTGSSVYLAKQMKELTWQRMAPWKIRTFLTRTKDFSSFTHEEMLLDIDTKNSLLFPEKISGQYVMLHREFPDMNIIYSDDLKTWKNSKKILSPSPGSWDSARVGGGSPPFKTERGWLHFYNGADEKNIYHIGFLLHDLLDPAKILYRSSEPIMTPTETWEKEGNISNVVFSCGVVEKDGKYLIYYGGADKVIGVASVDKEELFQELKKETGQ